MQAASTWRRSLHAKVTCIVLYTGSAFSQEALPSLRMHRLMVLTLNAPATDLNMAPSRTFESP